MSGRGDVLSNLIWKFGERISAQLVSTIVSIVLARLLMPDDYGVVAIVTIIITLCNSFVAGGFGNALIQKKDASETDFSSMFYVSFFVSVIVYFVLFFLAKPIATAYDNDLLCPIIRVMGLRLPVAGVNSIQQAYFSRNMQFKKFFFSTLVGTVVSAVVGIVMALKGYGPWALVSQYLTNVVIDTAFLFLVGGWHPKAVFDPVAVREMLPFSLRLMGATMLDSVFNEIRGIVIFGKYTASDLSMYENGRKYPNLIVTNINSSIGSVLFPAMSKLQSSTAQLAAMMKKSIRGSTFVLSPMLCGFFAVAPRFVSTVLTDKWIDCVPYIQITCCMCIFYPIHTINIQAMNSIGESGKILKLEILKKVLNILVLIISMNFGVVGIALGSLFVSLLSTWINAIYSKRFFNYSFFAQLLDIIPTLFLSTVMAALVILCDHYLDINGWVALILEILLGCAVYLVLCTVFKIKEIKTLAAFLKNARKKQRVEEK